MISRLPITGGTPIRVCLLSGPPYKDGRGFRFGDEWSFRSIPFRAVYNDYGSIEDVPPEDRVLVDLALAQFDRDAVELPLGENQYHDPPVTKGMPAERWWEALTEGRLRVRSSDTYEKVKVPAGVPTWRRVLKALLRAEAKGELPPGGTATRLAYGVVKVVFNGQWEKKTEWCEKLRPILERKYRVEVRHRYGLEWHREHMEKSPDPSPYTDVEYILAPKEGPFPPTNPHRERREQRFLKSLEGPVRHDPHAPIPVAWAFVREDVWQATLSLGGRELDWFPTPSVKQTKARLKAGIEKAIKSPVGQIIGVGYLLENDLHDLKTTPPFVQGIADEVAELAKQTRDGKVTAKTYGHALTKLSEFIVVRYVMLGACIPPVPTYGGPQDGAWDTQAALHAALAPVVAGAVKKQSWEEDEP
jgi:hypothetical protein